MSYLIFFEIKTKFCHMAVNKFMMRNVFPLFLYRVVVDEEEGVGGERKKNMKIRRASQRASFLF